MVKRPVRVQRSNTNYISQLRLQYHLKYPVSQLLLSDLQLHCTTEEANFPPLDSVRLVAFGLGNAEGDVLELEKVSRDTWKQAETAPLCEM